MSAVAAPADRRFRRAHVKPARKRRRLAGRFRMVPYVLAGVLVVAGAYWGAKAVAQAHMLRVDRITVRGNRRLSPGEVRALLGGLSGESLLWTDLDPWRERLLSSPWVRDAVLRRSLPSTVEVIVLEREPIGIGRMGGDLYLIDERGAIIDQYGPQYADLDLPIVDGLTLPPNRGGSAADETRAELAARVIAALRSKPEIGRRLSQIDVKDTHNANVILNGDPAVIELGDDQFLSRLQSYLELAPELRGRVSDIDYVDARFDSRIYVRPAAKPAKAGKQTAAPAKAGRPGGKAR